jgi:hypothetical protein
MAYPFILNGQNLSVYLKGTQYSINQAHPNFRRVVRGIKESLSEDDLIGLIQFHTELGSVDGVELREDGLACFDGKPVPDALIKRYKFMIENEFPVDGFRDFILNLSENPGKDSREDLYGFLEACSLPITEDGHFLAYKRVGKNYMDCHTGAIDNSVGKIVEMPRESVDADRSRTCSAGLHVCSRSYLGSIAGEHIMVCKINPRDVVSVPVDYGNAKMRVCRYEVIAELKDETGLIKDLAVKNGGEVETAGEGAVPLNPGAKTGKPNQGVSREEKWDDYIKTRGIPDDLTSLHGNPRKAFIKFCARLRNRDGSEIAGPDICGAKNLAEMRTVIFGF